MGAGEAAVGVVKWGAWLKQTLGCGVDGPHLLSGKAKEGTSKDAKAAPREQEADHEQEHVYMKGHNDPRCLKSGACKAPVSGRIRRVSHAVRAELGESSQLSTTEWGSTGVPDPKEDALFSPGKALGEQGETFGHKADERDV